MSVKIISQKKAIAAVVLTAVVAVVSLGFVVFANSPSPTPSPVSEKPETGRSKPVWDLLYVASCAARRAKENTDTVLFKLARIPRDGRSTRPETVELKSIIGPGDDPRPVITIMRVDQNSARPTSRLPDNFLVFCKVFVREAVVFFPPPIAFTALRSIFICCKFSANRNLRIFQQQKRKDDASEK